MKSFKFFKSEIIDQVISFDEALTPNQRFKRKIHFARSKPKMDDYIERVNALGKELEEAGAPIFLD